MRTHNAPQALTVHDVQRRSPNRTYYLTKKFKSLQQFISITVKDLLNSVMMAFEFDHLSLNHFTSILIPTLSSGAALFIGEMLASGSKLVFDDEKNAFIFKFLLGAAFIAQSSAKRITEKNTSSLLQENYEITRDMMGIYYLYTASFRAAELSLSSILNDKYALIGSLGVATLGVSGGMTKLVELKQQQTLKKLYAAGSQRSDTVVMSSGSTTLANLYFQMNHFLLTEISTVSRLFQLSLISNNILHAKKVLQQFRNLPALLADAGPPIIKRLALQQEKLARDYAFNNTYQTVLCFEDGKAIFSKRLRHELRNNDLVYCDNLFDVESTPVAGELIALQKNDVGEFTDALTETKYSINLKAHNGEDVWIQSRSSQQAPDKLTQVDLHSIHAGKQAAILPGTKLNLLGADNLFVRIKSEKERKLNQHYEKTAYINQIIAKYKQRNVLYSLVAACLMGFMLDPKLETFPATTLRLLFNVFQMMIPFSETFLREMVNSSLLKEINQHVDLPLATIDALRIVDLLHVLGGYYANDFKKGLSIVSDKTGTLTTSKMVSRGFWTKDMSGNIDEILSFDAIVLPRVKKQLLAFEVFSAAYTNNTKDVEPEESAILALFKELAANDALQVSVLANNHFKKQLHFDQFEKEILTWHLGLARKLGGRLTLVQDAGNYYLVFCGIPKAEAFQNTPLLADYLQMQQRTGVLSRDWAIARTRLSTEEFNLLIDLFNTDNLTAIEDWVFTNNKIKSSFTHYCTFLIDNPVKTYAQQFLAQCHEADIPVFISTGDTAGAAKNIVSVLYPDFAENILIIKNSEQLPSHEQLASASTIIFAGINPDVLNLFRTTLPSNKAIIIFAEMSTEDKGSLTTFLQGEGYFVVANGDGTNDIAMMKNANLVIAHLTENDSYAPGVEQYANLNDKQVRQLCDPEKSFYEVFDFHKKNSLLRQTFAPLANSQEKPSIGLLLKTSKMSFELAQAVAAPNLIEMWQQHWFSVGFDLIWLGLTFHSIKATTDLPFDNQHLMESNFSSICLLITLGLAVVQSATTYAITGESTNLNSMIMMLSLLPLVLKSIFNGYQFIQDELYPREQKPERPLSPQTLLNRLSLVYKRSFSMQAVVTTPCASISAENSLAPATNVLK